MHLEASTAKPVPSVTKVINSSLKGERKPEKVKQYCLVRFLEASTIPPVNLLLANWYQKRAKKKSREVRNGN